MGDGGQPDPADGGSPSNPQEQQPDGGSQDEEQNDPADQQLQDGGMSDRELSPKEVEALLESMKQNEKNLQLWRFQTGKKKSRKGNAKDW
jgi:hypothetical protein